MVNNYPLIHKENIKELTEPQRQLRDEVSEPWKITAFITSHVNAISQKGKHFDYYPRVK